MNYDFAASALDEGWGAYEDGLTLMDNPYAPASDLYYAWKEGWLSGYNVNNPGEIPEDYNI